MFPDRPPLPGIAHHQGARDRLRPEIDAATPWVDPGRIAFLDVETSPGAIQPATDRARRRHR
ncbi:MAG: hypothetical protein R3F14_34610 [Polyangiaceae bacterium]